MSNLQPLLDQHYLKYLNRIIDDPEFFMQIIDGSISSPQFVDITTPSAQYESSSIKIVFVGKETNGWLNIGQRNELMSEITSDLDTSVYLDVLKRIYRDHNLGKAYNTPIFQFIHQIVDYCRNQLTPNVGFVLTELLRHDQGGKKMKLYWRNKSMHNKNEILREELNLLSPDLVIFLTGQGYDSLIHDTFDDCNFIFYDESLYGWSTACLIQNSHLSFRMIRLSHPGYYHRSKGRMSWEQLKALVIGEIESIAIHKGESSNMTKLH